MRQTDHDQTERKVSQDLDDLQNLLIKLTVKASSEKAWLLYEFSFSLNPEVTNQMMHRHDRTIGAIALSYLPPPSLLLLMTRHEKTRLKALP